MRIARWFYILPLRLRSLFRKQQVELELNEEVRFHIERQTQAFINNGMTPEDARYAALRAFGDSAQRKEECRDSRRVHLLEALAQDVRYGLRGLRKSPGFTAAALLTLALGIGFNVAIFAVVEAVLLRPLPYSDAGKLVVLNHKDQRTGITKEYIAIGDYLDIAARQSTFEAFGAYGSAQGSVFGLGEPFRVAGLSADANLLAALRVQPVLGQNLRPEDSRPGAAPVVMLSYDLWQSHFGADPNVVGRGIQIGQTQRQIIGVAPAGFQFPPNAHTEVIVPLELPLQAPTDRKSDWTFAAGRLKSGRSVEEATANLSAISKQLEGEYPQSNQASEYFPLSLRDSLVGNTKPALLLLFAAVGVVMLIACVNVANLFLARSLARGREVALRTALGAGRSRLAAQFFVESLVLAAAASAVGIVMARWGIQGLIAIVPRSVNVPGLSTVRINGLVLVFTLGVGIAISLTTSLASALTLRTGNPASTLGAASRVSMNLAARRTSSVLVAAEVALAIVLLIGAGLIFRSFSALLSVDPGFRTGRVLTMDIIAPANRYRTPDARQAFFQSIFAAFHGLAPVQEAGAAVVVPLTGNNWTVSFERLDKPAVAGERPPEVGWQAASGGFFKTLQIPLLSGRLFNDTDNPESMPVVIISDAIRQSYFPNENPIGMHLKTGDRHSEIVGVVGNIRRAGLRDTPRADLYFPFEQNPSNSITLFVRTSADPVQELASLQSVIRSLEPNIVFTETHLLTDIASQSVAETDFALWLLGIFAITALALAAIGIYGVMSYSVRQRTREIGTRLALGASKRDIVWLVMRQGAGVASIGIVVGVVTGLIAARSLSVMLYGITASDPITLGCSVVLLFLVTMAACYLPARRAASVDPVRTLTEQ